MAKESMKARELKRQKLVEKYAEKRAALKAAGQEIMKVCKNFLKMHRLFDYTIVVN